ncbi:extracellular solute-binding protein family 1 [Parafrankia sp. EAN1pec]|uniref:ABC transporter substrate-binding protein n=1 Tax=Parafrankia sp. (strain EAN1pec) TaxID=298653 RepID=UPI00005422B3|nr:extracellular solute-binding protein family 1 [Frankia sp. EAN1pec]
MIDKGHHLRNTRLAALILGSLVFAAGCGGGGSASSENSDRTAGMTWDQILSCAREEGTVTYYSSNIPNLNKAVGEALNAKYGIRVESYRDVDATIHQRVDAEIKTGKVVADVVQTASPLTFQRMAEAGELRATAGPAFDSPDYRPEYRHADSQYFQTNSPFFVPAWNTDLLPAGLKDYSDLLKPELRGRIAIQDPSVSNVILDHYLWMERTEGPDFLPALAALAPRVYPSQVQSIEALAAGEVAATTIMSPSLIAPRKAAGAPVDYVLPSGGSYPGSHFYASVLAGAPHPCAAQVLANFLVTSEGQDVVAENSASALPNVPGSPITIDKVEATDPNKFTDEFVDDHLATWTKLFRR